MVVTRLLFFLVAISFETCVETTFQDFEFFEIENEKFCNGIFKNDVASIVPVSKFRAQLIQLKQQKSSSPIRCNGFLLWKQIFYFEQGNKAYLAVDESKEPIIDVNYTYSSRTSKSVSEGSIPYFQDTITDFFSQYVRSFPIVTTVTTTYNYFNEILLNTRDQGDCVEIDLQLKIGNSVPSSISHGSLTELILETEKNGVKQFLSYMVYVVPERRRYRICVQTRHSDYFYIHIIAREFYDVQIEAFNWNLYYLTYDKCRNNFDCFQVCEYPLKYLKNGTCGTSCGSNAYLKSENWRCETCSEKCALGTFELQSCTSRNDKICAVCPFLECSNGTLTCEANQTGSVQSRCNFCSPGEYFDEINGICHPCTAYKDCKVVTGCSLTSDAKCEACQGPFHGTNCTEPCDSLPNCEEESCNIQGTQVVCEKCRKNFILEEGSCITCDKGVQKEETCGLGICENLTHFDPDDEKCISSCTEKPDSFRIPNSTSCQNCTRCANGLVEVNQCFSSFDSICTNSSFVVFLENPCDPFLIGQIELEYNSSVLFELEKILKSDIQCSEKARCVPVENNPAMEAIYCDFFSDVNETMAMKSLSQEVNNLALINRNVAKVKARSGEEVIFIRGKPPIAVAPSVQTEQNKPAIIGGSIVAVLFVVCVITLAIYGIRRYRRKVKQLNCYKEPLPGHLETFLNLKTDEEHEEASIRANNKSSDGLKNESNGQEYMEMDISAPEYCQPLTSPKVARLQNSNNNNRLKVESQMRLSEYYIPQNAVTSPNTARISTTSLPPDKGSFSSYTTISSYINPQSIRNSELYKNNNESTLEDTNPPGKVDNNDDGGSSISNQNEYDVEMSHCEHNCDFDDDYGSSIKFALDQYVDPQDINMDN